MEGVVERQGQKRWKGELRDKERTGKVKGGVEKRRENRKGRKGELRDKERIKNEGGN